MPLKREKKLVEGKKNDEIYRKLQHHLDKMPIGYPRAESGTDILLLKMLFTPEEAKIATYLKFDWFRTMESLDTIYKRVKSLEISLKDLEKTLDNMAKKGSILSKMEGKKKYFANAPLIIGMYEFQVDKLSREFLEVLSNYVGEVWRKKANPTKYDQLRIIPVEIEVEPELGIAQYDDVRRIIERSNGPFVKINCICRQAKDLAAEPCKMTEHRDNCLGLGDMAQMYIDQGYGVEINKEETLQILERNREEGLILRPSNSQKVEFICSCCYCCDGAISSLKEITKPVDYVLSNYYSIIDQELCVGCGSCIERCQTIAIKLGDEKALIDKKRCIGCGNCITICPSKAITLHKKEIETIPPESMDDLYSLIQKEKRKSTKTN